MKLHVLGSNGWYSTSNANTVCILIEAEDYYVVLDAGDGIYKLDEYIKDDKPIYLFLSHFHLDHSAGLHILGKFRFSQELTIFGQPGTKKTLASLVSHPFTIPFEDLRFKVTVRELSEGEHNSPDTPLSIEARYLVHADPCYGYKLMIDDKAITYCTDTGPCDNLTKLASGADLLITECALGVDKAMNPEWPHLNPEMAAALANEAGANKLVLTHFGATNYLNLEDREGAKCAAEKIFSPVIIANDGLELEI